VKQKKIVRAGFAQKRESHPRQWVD